jgi:hypothetical protein
MAPIPARHAEHATPPAVLPDLVAAKQRGPAAHERALVQLQAKLSSPGFALLDENGLLEHLCLVAMYPYRGATAIEKQVVETSWYVLQDLSAHGSPSDARRIQASGLLGHLRCFLLDESAEVPLSLHHSVALVLGNCLLDLHSRWIDEATCTALLDWVKRHPTHVEAAWLLSTLCYRPSRLTLAQTQSAVQRAMEGMQACTGAGPSRLVSDRLLSATTALGSLLARRRGSVAALLLQRSPAFAGWLGAVDAQLGDPATQSAQVGCLVDCLASLHDADAIRPVQSLLTLQGVALRGLWQSVSSETKRRLAVLLNAFASEPSCVTQFLESGQFACVADALLTEQQLDADTTSVLVQAFCGVLGCGHDAATVHAVEWPTGNYVVRSIVHHWEALDPQSQRYALGSLERAVKYYDVCSGRAEGESNKVRSYLLEECGDFLSRIRELDGDPLLDDASVELSAALLELPVCASNR